MITSITSQKLVVISDLHLGNPFSNAKKKVIPFLKWAAQEKFDVCINGDGLEIAQASFSKVAFEVPEFFRVLGEFRRAGREVYYVTGNHDIALEHFLEDWGVMKVAPFLNVTSGDTRIRIEHGHIYDPFFVKFPVLYDSLTHLAGILLKIHPELYRLWISFERWTSNRRAKKTGIVGERPHFREAALEHPSSGNGSPGNWQYLFQFRLLDAHSSLRQNRKWECFAGRMDLSEIEPPQSLGFTETELGRADRDYLKLSDIDQSFIGQL